MDDIELENNILELLSPIDPVWSNQLHRELGGVNKARYTRIRDKMIEEDWIKTERKGRELLLTRINFEAPKFDEQDWTKTTRTNCTNWLQYFKDRKPLFRKNKVRTKDLKYMLDAYFHELDRQMIVCTRLVNAEALGLILPSRSRKHQKKCVEFVHEFVKKLLRDHKEFKEEIKEYAQSQLRTVQFKI